MSLHREVINRTNKYDFYYQSLNTISRKNIICIQEFALFPDPYQAFSVLSAKALYKPL